MSSGMSMADIDALMGEDDAGEETWSGTGSANPDEGVYRVTAKELMAFLQRFERLEEEGKAISDFKKELLAEVKSRGYDTKVFKKVVALRKRDPDDIAEEEAVLEMYREALGV